MGICFNDASYAVNSSELAARACSEPSKYAGDWGGFNGRWLLISINGQYLTLTENKFSLDTSGTPFSICSKRRFSNYYRITTTTTKDYRSYWRLVPQFTGEILTCHIGPPLHENFFLAPLPKFEKCIGRICEKS